MKGPGKNTLPIVKNLNEKIQCLTRRLLFYYLLFVLSTSLRARIRNSEIRVQATSINYGIYQTPITDVTLLMPKLCQNQSTICEGSFCIPGIRRCVCDLRMPVQFDRYCLKQVDIDTKCFVTSQCNHTVKDAVCIDINSNAVLDIESSRFKLDQWQQLNELRQLSQLSLNSGSSSIKQQRLEPTKIKSIASSTFTFYDDPFEERSLVELRDDVIKSDVRNSPYEINYNTPELLHQNHTRRRYDHSADRDHLQSLAHDTRIIQSQLPITLPPLPTTSSSQNDLNSQQQSQITTPSTMNPTFELMITTTTIIPVDLNSLSTTHADSIESMTATPSIENQSLTSFPETSTTTNSTPPPFLEATPTSSVIFTTTPTTTSSTTRSTILPTNRKLVTKNQSWPPGICSCPFGHIFNSKLRKCMIPSLVDSHCTVDHECKQIPFTHCSRETRRCICDEPLIWTQSACVRPGLQQQQDLPANEQTLNEKNKPSLDNQLELGATHNTGSLLSSATFSLLENVSLSIILILIFFIIGILIIVEFVRCFSGSNNTTLVSPRRQQNDQKQKAKQKPNTSVNINGMIQTNASASSNSRSPYATLRRDQENGPNTHLSNFTQTTRGRILNYDFEQENNGPSKSGGGGISKTDTIGSHTQSNSSATNALKITFLFIV